jgi:hypothetical protein
MAAPDDGNRHEYDKNRQFPAENAKRALRDRLEKP